MDAPPSDVQPTSTSSAAASGTYVPFRWRSLILDLSIVHIFNNAKNTRITNSSFNISNTNNNTYNLSATPSPLDVLNKAVAPNAILNAGGRADEVRCRPGTREEVIGLVKKFIAQEHTGPRILWLSGPASAGKSAIM